MNNEKRNRVVKVRFSDSEWDTLNDKKSRPELARWIRETVLAVEPTKLIRANSNFPPELARILAGMGNNLNQIAKQLNVAATTEWAEVLTCLVNDVSLPEKYRDHALIHDKNGYRDCHVKPDLVLIYGKKENVLILVRLGSHSEIFG